MKGIIYIMFNSGAKLIKIRNQFSSDFMHLGGREMRKHQTQCDTKLQRGVKLGYRKYLFSLLFQTSLKLILLQSLYCFEPFRQFAMTLEQKQKQTQKKQNNPEYRLVNNYNMNQRPALRLTTQQSCIFACNYQNSVSIYISRVFVSRENIKRGGGIALI